MNIIYETAKISLQILNNGNVPHGQKEFWKTEFLPDTCGLGLYSLSQQCCEVNHKQIKMYLCSFWFL
jgi:hypothetical protein